MSRMAPVFLRNEVTYHHSEEQDGPNVLEKRPVIEWVGRLQDDGWQQPVEEEFRGVLREHARLNVVDESAEACPHQDQQAAVVT